MAANRLLGKHDLPIHGYLKHSTGGWDELRLDIEFLAKVRRQTGSARLVVSNDAIADRDVHGQNRSVRRAGGKGARLILDR